MIPGLLPSYCASPLVPSVGYIPRGAGSHNPVAGLHRPHGWLQRRRPLSAEKEATSAAATSPRRAFPPGTEATLARVSSRRRRRQRYLETRLHGTDSSSSASSSPSSSTSPPPTTTTTATTTTQPPSPPLGSGAFSGEGGAEWAGWECRFSGANGKPVPVPEDYVPESLREWDVEVWGFETLTSEQLRPGGGGEEGKRKGDNGGSSALYRKRGRVYPETGCALDNLTLEVNAQTSPLEGDGTFVASFPEGGHVLGKKAKGSTSLQLEVGVVVPGVQQFTDPSMTLTEDEAAGADKEMSRLRVEFRVDSTSGSSNDDGDTVEATAVLGPTVTVTRERRYRDTFDDGLLYKGGGLDSQKLRRLLRSKCFAESEAAPVPDDLAGHWAARNGHWQPLDGPTTRADATTTASGVGNAFDKEGVQTLLLPGGITVRSGPWRHPDDGTSETSATAAVSDGTGGVASSGEAGWAVEVGWFLGVGEAGERRNERVALTTVLDARTMTPLAVWKGEEARE